MPTPQQLTMPQQLVLCLQEQQDRRHRHPREAAAMTDVRTDQLTKMRLHSLRIRTRRTSSGARRSTQVLKVCVQLTSIPLTATPTARSMLRVPTSTHSNEPPAPPGPEVRMEDCPVSTMVELVVSAEEAEGAEVEAVAEAAVEEDVQVEGKGW